MNMSTNFKITVLILSLASCSMQGLSEYSFLHEEEFNSIEEISFWMLVNMTYYKDETDCWQLPEETYIRKGGDCEDTSLLMTYFAHEIGLEADILIVDNEEMRELGVKHAIVQVDNRWFDAGLYEIYNIRYRVIEVLDYYDALWRAKKDEQLANR